MSTPAVKGLGTAFALLLSAMELAPVRIGRERAHQAPEVQQAKLAAARAKRESKARKRLRSL